MEYEFWESPTGKCPVCEELEKLQSGNPEAYEVFMDKLERFRSYDYNLLRKSGIIDKIKGHNPYKIHELRIPLPDITCRLYCLPGDGKLWIYHMTIKKSPKLKPKDLEIASARVKLHHES